MKQLLLFAGIFLLFHYSTLAQVGINNNNPATALDITGAVRTRPVSVDISNNEVHLTTETSLAIVSGSATATILVFTDFTPSNGQRLTIHNASTGGYDAVLGDVSIPPLQLMEFVFSNNQWLASFTNAKSNSLMINVADSGIVPDNVDRSQQIRQVIENAQGKPLFFPPGKYKYDGAVIATPHVYIVGVMPVFSNGVLEQGTVFLNKLSFTSIYAVVEGIGVQLASPDDGFRITPPINTGKYCRVKDIVTVGGNTTSPFHSFLIEGFDYLYADHVECYNGYMGQVIKVKSGNLSNFRDFNIAKEAVFLKSDNISSNCKNLTLQGVHVENVNSGTATGIKVNSAGAQFQNLSIDNVQIQKVQFGISVISSGGSGIAINNLNFSNVKIDGTSLKCVYLEANSGFVYKTNFSNFDVTAVSKSLFETLGNIKYININNFNADISNTTTVAEKEQITNFGSATKATNISNLNVTKAYNPDDDLAIYYGNGENENRIQQYNIRLRGNKPQALIQSIVLSSGSETIQPQGNTFANTSFCMLSTELPATAVQQIAKAFHPSYPTELFPKGWILTLKNNGNLPILLMHNPTGNMVHPHEQNIELAPKSSIQYFFDGSVWSPVESAFPAKKAAISFAGSGELTLDNIRVIVPETGDNSVMLAAVNSNFTASGYASSIASTVPATAQGIAVLPNYWKVQQRPVDNNPLYWQSGLHLSQIGDSQTIYLYDETTDRNYRITFKLGTVKKLSIERE